jgi:cytochrome c
MRKWPLALLIACAALPAVAAPGMGDPVSGQALFKARCQACHSVTPGQKALLAPNLAGVIGRKAGTGDFATYSAALKASGLVWNRANLAQFIAGPQALVPGTRMVVTVADPAQRADLAAYLATAK